MYNPFNIISSFRLSFLPPLMIYLAAGISGLTNIVGLFLSSGFHRYSSNADVLLNALGEVVASKVKHVLIAAIVRLVAAICCRE